MYGRPRQTRDADLVIAFMALHVQPLARALAVRGWYVSETAMREAIEARG